MNNVIRTGVVIGLAALDVVHSAAVMADVKASDGWVRATPPGVKVAAAYLTLTNPGTEERKLLKVVSPITDAVTLHRTSITHEGVARMWPLAVLAVPAGQALRLEPNGVHVMLNALQAPLVAGQKVPLTMKFDGGEAEFTMMLEVRPLVPPASEHPHR